jgi:hypothetical protein
MQRTTFSSLSAAALLALSGFSSADVLITEVVDGTLPGGLPKWAEITNTGSSDADLSAYSIGNINNGGTTLGGGAALVLTGTLAAGQSTVGSYEADPGAPMTSNFYLVYGVEADFYFGGAYINGDDCIALYLGAATGDGTNATLVDVYGVIGVDGSGTTWEYQDSYAYRCGNTANNGVFDESDWTIAGANALEEGCGGDDTCEAANLVANTTPGTHVGCAGPSVGSAYCSGDQATCPCGNDNDGSNGTAGCANGGNAGGAAISASGSASASAGDLVLNVTGAIGGQPGLFFQGMNSINGGMGNPFGDGLRCAGGGVIRLQVATSDASGNASTSINIATKGGVVAGDVKRYQNWYRDPASSPCGASFNLSNGYEITWGA